MQSIITLRNIIIAVAAIFVVASMVNFHNASQFAKVEAPSMGFALGWRGCQFLAGGILTGLLALMVLKGK